jgi:hypothetical protein
MKTILTYITEKLFIRKSNEPVSEFEIGDTVYRLKKYTIRDVDTMYKPMPGIIEDIKMVTIIQVDKTKRIEPHYKIKNIQGWTSIVFATEEEAIEYCNDKKLKIRRY